jgi:phenylacetate-CoA ligase
MLPLLSRLWWRRYLSRNSSPWRELQEFPALPPDARRQLMASRLLAQLQYFGRRDDALPEWREAASLRDPEEVWRIWPQLPVISKPMLASRFPAAELAGRFHLAGRVDGSGGSTGEPTRFFHDTPMLFASVALDVFTRRRMGWRPGMPAIIVWGSERDIGRATPLRPRLHNWLLGNYLVDGYRFDEATTARVLLLIERHKPVAIYGFTSLLEQLARSVVASGRVPPPGAVRTAWNGGEMLFPEQSDWFRRAFGVPILNRYGGREVSALACQSTPDGPLEIMRPWQFVEIVDEKGDPAPPGVPGRVLWTSTVCRGTPFLRYDSGDLASWSPGGIDEAGLAAFDRLHGRVASTMQLPDGTVVSNLYWNHLFKEFHEVQRFQVVLRHDGGIRLLLTGAGFTPEREAALRAILRGFLGGPQIGIEWVERIPLTSQGKLIQVVREAPPPPVR